MQNITKETEEYIKGHSRVKECLKKGLINYSALARSICEEKKWSSDNFDAVLIAIRRLYDKIKKDPKENNKIVQVLKESKLEVKNKVSVFILEPTALRKNIILIQNHVVQRGEQIHVIDGRTAITIVTAEEFAPLIKKSFKNKIISQSHGLAEINVVSPETIETIPGFTSYFFSLFGEKNINIVETFSCWTDTILLVEEKHVSDIMQILHF